MPWLAIIAVPTAIAGIYGMNFKHMPELEWPWAYPVLWLVLALIASGILSTALSIWRGRLSACLGQRWG